MKPSEISVSRLPEMTISAQNMSSDHKDTNNSLMNSLNSVTITSVDLRTSNKESRINDIACEAPKLSSNPVNEKPKLLKSRESEYEKKNDCQIIDLTDTSTPSVQKPIDLTETVVRKSSKTKPEMSIKPTSSHKSFPQPEEASVIQLKPEENLHSISSIMSGKFTKDAPQVPVQVNEDDMEQVMKDLKELQQMQEHVRSSEPDLMAPSSSPVSVIAYNSSYSSNKSQPSDLSTKDRKYDGPGFQEMFQKHLFQDMSYKTTQPNVYNSNVSSKSNYNRCS